MFANFLQRKKKKTLNSNKSTSPFALDDVCKELANIFTFKSQIEHCYKVILDFSNLKKKNSFFKNS